MIEILLITLLVFAVSGYAGLWLRSRRKSRALSRGAAPLRLSLESPVVLPTKEQVHRRAEEEWLIEYALSGTPRQLQNLENVWNNYVEKRRPSTWAERERLRREFLIMVGRKKMERELGN